jgi:hypothetical protein
MIGCQPRATRSPTNTSMCRSRARCASSDERDAARHACDNRAHLGQQPAQAAVMKLVEPWQCVIARIESAPVSSTTVLTATGWSRTAPWSSVHVLLGSSLRALQASIQTSSPSSTSALDQRARHRRAPDLRAHPDAVGEQHRALGRLARAADVEQVARHAVGDVERDQLVGVCGGGPHAPGQSFLEPGPNASQGFRRRGRRSARARRPGAQDRPGTSSSARRSPAAGRAGSRSRRRRPRRRRRRRRRRARRARRGSA